MIGLDSSAFTAAAKVLLIAVAHLVSPFAPPLIRIHSQLAAEPSIS
jgi:hypothetical protein